MTFWKWYNVVGLCVLNTRVSDIVACGTGKIVLVCACEERVELLFTSCVAVKGQKLSRKWKKILTLDHMNFQYP
jgi:hypothetical protein